MSSFSNFPKSVIQQLILNPIFKRCNFTDFKKCMSDPEYTHDQMVQWIRENPNSKRAHILFELLSYKSENLKYTRKNQHKDLEFENPIIYAAGSNKYADGTNYFDKPFWWVMIGWITAEERHGNGWRISEKIYQSIYDYSNPHKHENGLPPIKEQEQEIFIKELSRVGKDWKWSMTNRFWLNNLGAKATAEKITRQKENGLWTQKPVGINVALWAGDMKEQYPYVVKTLYEHGDFFELNFSCPNHKWLSEIQGNVNSIRETIQSVKNVNIAKKPLVVKFGILSNNPTNMDNAQDLTYDALEQIINMCCEELDETQDKINITNTAKEHTGYDSSKELTDKDGNIVWGMSWKLIQERSLQTVQFVKEIIDKNGSKLWIIGTGGIWCDEAWQTGKQLIAMKDAWAELFNMFTGFVYNPTSLAKNLRVLDRSLKNSFNWSKN